MSVKALYQLVLAIDIGGQILTGPDLYDGKIVVEEASHKYNTRCPYTAKGVPQKKHRHTITAERCLVVVEKIYYIKIC